MKDKYLIGELALGVLKSWDFYLGTRLSGNLEAGDSMVSRF